MVSITNDRVAELFNQMADLLEIRSANSFRVRAYRNAARIIQSWPVEIAELVQVARKEKKLFPKIPGIGKDLFLKICEISESGSFLALEDLKKQVPAGLRELLLLPGLGPKRVYRLNHELGIASLSDFETALQSGRVLSLPGFGSRLVTQLTKGLLEGKADKPRRFSIGLAEQEVTRLITRLKEHPSVLQLDVAGSYRRGRDTVGDLDLVLSCNQRGTRQVVDFFLTDSQIDRVLARGDTKCSVLLSCGIQVDLRLVGKRSYGAALQYLTGSKAHNLAIRSMALRAGLKINEYGIFRAGTKVGGATESDIYQALGLPFIPPEIREGEGEIQAALSGSLPQLVQFEDIRGDLHVHTSASDGHASIREMAFEARNLGYDYLAVTDHSPRLAVTHGLDPKRLSHQLLEIDRLNEELYPFRILKGCEVDILKDGSLDLPDEIMERLDLTVCSIHSHFDLSAEAQLRRVRRAMSHRGFTILGHPTCRLIGRLRQRNPIVLDMEECLQMAKENGVFVEANGQPERLDLAGPFCKLARELGVLVALSTDAHSVHELGYMRFALAQARRGWLEKPNVMNCRPWPEIESLIKLRRAITPKKEAA